MPELTTLARVRGALRIPAGATIHDARITEIIDEVEDQILNDLNLNAFEATTYTDKFDTKPGDQTSFVLSRFPVLSVVALTMDGEALVEGTQFHFERSGQVKLIAQGGMLPNLRQAVDVTWTAGVVAVAGTTPAHMTRWATLEAALQYNTEHMAGIGEQSIRPVRRVLSDPERDQVRREIQRIAARYARPSG